VKFGGGSVMIWGCFTSRDVSGYYKIDGTINAKLYQQILYEDLIDTIRYYEFSIDEVIFQHDNDPKHIAKLTKQWLKNNKVKVLNWLSQSPELNPIEYL
jgi:hypothetical protein